MPKRLIVLNLLLAAAIVAGAAHVVRELTAPLPPIERPRATGAAPAEAPPPEKPREPAGSYAVVATRNLFSPTRSEAPPAPPQAAVVAPAVTLPKPSLYGVVLREGAPIAYLQDPTTKRVAGYRVGDAIAGGTVQTIAADRVVLARPDGNIDVRLHDPSKPKPAPVAPTPRPAPGVQPPGVAPTPTQRFGAQVPGQPPLTPRRPLPPSLLRRVPQAPPGEASGD
jgi:hypothetical protein